MKLHYLVLPILLITFLGCSNQDDLTPWDFIDDQALLIIEKSSEPVSIDSIQKDQSTFFQVFNANAKARILVFQSISATDFETLWIFKLNQTAFSNLLNEIRKQKLKLSERSYNGTAIFEITNKNLTYSFSFRDGIFLYSLSPLLVENAIRHSEKPPDQRAHSKKNILSGFSMVKEDNGNVLVRNEELTQLIKLPVWVEAINHLYQKDVLSLLDFKQSESSIYLNGFSLAGTDSRLHYFQQQLAIPIQITRYVPGYVNLFFHFGISDFGRFNEHHEVDSTLRYTTFIGNEIVLYNNRKDEPGLIIELAEDISREKLSQMINSHSDFIEYIGDIEIRKLKSNHPFQSLFTQFNISDSALYLTIKEDVILVSNHIDDLKITIEAVDRDDTWGKSLSFQDFFEKCLQESNYSLFVKNIRPESKKSTKLKKVLQDLGLNNLQWLSIQHSALDNHFYSNVNIALNRSKDQPSKTVDYEFDQPIVSFHLVSSDKATDILVEDSKSQIYAISESKKRTWQYNLGSRIIQSVKSLDYFKNKKTQFQIATEGKLHIVDRLGRSISNYPFNLPGSFVYNEVIDYDRSGNYRFLFAKGNEIYLFDKSQKSLAGWNPKRLANDLLFSPKHYRIGGKDYFLVILKDGSILLFNRRGEVIPGYPKMTDNRISGDYHLQKGSSLQTTYITLVNKEGMMFRVNLGSGVVEKNELIRSKDGIFSLLNHQGETNFSIVRVDPSGIAMFDFTGKLQFEISNPGSPSPHVQIFKRIDGSLLYAFFDSSQKITYLFDPSGLILAPSPLESSLPIQLVNEAGVDILYVAQDKKLRRIPL